MTEKYTACLDYTLFLSNENKHSVWHRININDALNVDLLYMQMKQTCIVVFWCLYADALEAVTSRAVSSPLRSEMQLMEVAPVRSGSDVKHYTGRLMHHRDFFESVRNVLKDCEYLGLYSLIL